MNQKQLQTDNPHISQALNELADLVRRRYPEATFQVTQAEDDPSIVHLLTRVDVEDTEEVADLVMARMIRMHVDEGLPVYVIPLRTTGADRCLAASTQSPAMTAGEYVPASTS